MPGGYPTFPDAEAVVSGVIRAANITNLGTRVFSSIPKSPQYALAVIQRVGGLPAVPQYLDNAHIQIDVWGGAKGDPPAGPTKSDIRTIVAAIRQALFNAIGTSVTGPPAAFISSVEDAQGITWLPDPASGRDRYIVAFNVYVR